MAMLSDHFPYPLGNTPLLGLVGLGNCGLFSVFFFLSGKLSAYVGHVILLRLHEHTSVIPPSVIARNNKYFFMVAG